MGTSIIWTVERRDVENGWLPVGTYVATFDSLGESWGCSSIPYPWKIDWRNYYLFAALSGVRNGGLFKEGVPIMPCNGIPADIHPINRKVLEGSSSESHATLQQLKEANWDITDAKGIPFKKTPEYRQLCRVMEAMRNIEGVESSDDVRAIWGFT